MYQHYTFKGEISEILDGVHSKIPGRKTMGFGQGGSPQIPSRHFRAAQLCVPLQQNLTGRHRRFLGNLKVRCDLRTNQKLSQIRISNPLKFN